jgi:hypothetical protein
MVGYGPFSLCVIHKEGLCPSSEDINRLMMMMNLPLTIYSFINLKLHKTFGYFLRSKHTQGCLCVCLVTAGRFILCSVDYVYDVTLFEQMNN